MDLEGTSTLPKEKKENVTRRIGTSLFTLGSFPIEYTYYGDQFRAEWQAEAVDTVGAAFLGLTLACARCHDHKFDPISQRDYYRMSAIFAGSVEREIPLVSLFDVETNSRNFPLLAQAQAWKRMARAARRGSKESGGPEAQRSALMQHLGEAYLRAPERYPTANVLAHEEIVPETHILVRGDFKNRGAKVERGLSRRAASRPADRGAVRRAIRSAAPQSARLVAYFAGKSPPRPRDGKSHLAGPLRRRDRQDSERFRPAGGATHPSGAAGLARGGVCLARMEHQADAPADHAFERIPLLQRRRRGEPAKGPGQSLSQPDEQAATRWRCPSRLDPRHCRNSESEEREAWA